MAGIVAAPSASLAATTPRPNFQLPFTCGESWRLTTYQGHDDYDIDFFANDGRGTAGRAILASADGTVIWAGWNGKWGDGTQAPPGSVGTASGLGYGVIISHGGGWVTVYGHFVAWPNVSTGQSVTQGQHLGNVGKTGATQVEHLHYEQLDDTRDPNKTRGVGDKVESYFDGSPSGITTDGSARTGPIYVDGSPSPTQYRTSNNCGYANVVEQAEYADIDGDGRADLIGVSGPNNDLTAYRNQGWSASSGVIVGWDRKSLVSGFGDASRTTFADIDGDGRADLISVSGPNNDITAYRNQGWNSANGVIVGWDRKLLVSGFGSLNGLKFADIDGDRRADLITTTGTNNDVTVYRNQGWNASSGVIVGWDRKPLVSGFGGPLEFDFADIDGDRRADLVAASGANNDLTVYRNQGWNASSGVIVGWDRKALVSGFGALWPLKLADMDGDLRSDVVAVSGVNNDHTAYRNQGWSSTALIVGSDRRSITSGFPA
ncbi:VCBS repeat domain-containing M23 family metallopeptidase [Micromonospora echinaurantiaca]|uniref:VCBS repeat domain-containing M23 family metallopeptidase n=1 Tax=Micromonospora echinaurantiaca TaxID=47857 RepID=UPI0012FD6E06|nr:VCBS repeat domain-containing M23 family metallopeptidase [Micromonospora echinaurantiaca]